MGSKCQSQVLNENVGTFCYTVHLLYILREVGIAGVSVI